MSSQLRPGTDLFKIPAGKPPPGQIPNFDDPPSLAPTLIGMNVFLIIWGVTFASLRVFMNRRRLRVGDAFVIIAVILSLAYCSVLLSSVRYFRHFWDLPLGWYTPTYIKLLFSQNMLLGPTIFFGKEAIILLYFEIFHIKRAMKIAILVGMVFTGLVYWTSIIIAPIFCAPHIGETWDPLYNTAYSGRCTKAVYWGIVQGACAIVMDVYIFLVPIPDIMQLRLAPRRKIQLLGVFMTAILGILASVLAEVFRVQLLNIFGTDQDSSWAQSQYLICMCGTSVVENWVAVIVSCMPAVANFSRRYIAEPRLFQSLQSRLLGWARYSSKRESLGGWSSPSGLHPGSEPRSSSLTGPYYMLEERALAGGAKSGAKKSPDGFATV